MRLPLIEKYRAESFEDIKGQDKVIEQVKDFLLRFPKNKALILSGPVGTGKTSIAIASAKEYNYELFELNASDLRNRLKLEEVLKPAMEQQSLFKKGKIIFMDEADGITTSDRGGLPELIYLIEKTYFPVIITANDIWQKKFSPLRQKCRVIEVKELDKKAISGIIGDILKKENKKINKETIELIIEKSRGDARAAINDLQSVFSSGEEALISEVEKEIRLDTEITKEIIEEDREEEKVSISEREKQDTIFNAMKKVFQSETNEKILNVYDNINMDLSEIALWIEENIPMEYKDYALAYAYNNLSKSDVFKGRIYRQQYWRFLVYQNFFLSAGISSATKTKYNKFVRYNRPNRILKIWLSNQKNAKKKSVAVKYAKYTHTSKKRALKDDFLIPFLLNETVQEKLQLDEKERKYINDKRGAIIVSHNLNRFRT
jgi:replication factor C large subunit